MKISLSPILRLALSGALLSSAVSCATSKSPPPASSAAAAAAAASAPSQKPKAQKPAAKDDFDDDEYAAVEVKDPLEALNRATFMLNDGIYTVILRPVSKGYEILFPKPVRTGLDNAFENVKYPVRLVNCALQGRFKRAGQETGKFFVNTIAGIGGIMKPSEKVPALADVPEEDTGQTFARWGIGHGPYIVLPLFGPSSAREAVGLACDYALSPPNWGFYWHNRPGWTYIPPSVNTLRALPAQFELYDAATKDAVDPYISARSSYIQSRAEAARR